MLPWMVSVNRWLVLNRKTYSSFWWRWDTLCTYCKRVEGRMEEGRGSQAGSISPSCKERGDLIVGNVNTWSLIRTGRPSALTKPERTRRRKRKRGEREKEKALEEENKGENRREEGRPRQLADQWSRKLSQHQGVPWDIKEVLWSNLRPVRLTSRSSVAASPWESEARRQMRLLIMNSLSWLCTLLERLAKPNTFFPGNPR